MYYWLLFDHWKHFGGAGGPLLMPKSKKVSQTAKPSKSLQRDPVSLRISSTIQTPDIFYECGYDFFYGHPDPAPHPGEHWRARSLAYAGPLGWTPSFHVMFLIDIDLICKIFRVLFNGSSVFLETDFLFLKLLASYSRFSKSMKCFRMNLRRESISLVPMLQSHTNENLKILPHGVCERFTNYRNLNVRSIPLPHPPAPPIYVGGFSSPHPPTPPKNRPSASIITISALGSWIHWFNDQLMDSTTHELTNR